MATTRKRAKDAKKKGYTTRKPRKKQAKKRGMSLGSGMAERGRKLLKGRGRQLNRQIERQGG